MTQALTTPVSLAIEAIGRIRPAAKPLHPKGIVVPATVHRFGTQETFGVPWLDEPGSDAAVVRLSRSVGLPAALPDILGLALRVRPDDRPADLLFATGGRGILTRFVLLPRRSALVAAAPYTTLLPYRTRTGPVLLSAVPETQGEGLRIRLAVARATGRWQDFGAVDVPSLASAHDEPVDFDPSLYQLEGLTPYPWWARLRGDAYAAARDTRGA